MLALTPSATSWWTTLFLHVNSFARDTPWLHPVLTLYANDGIALFALLLLAGWWLARRSGTTTTMAAAVWAPIGMLLALAVNQPVVRAFHGTRPYANLPGILVLANRTTDPSFPSDHATMAGAVTVGLLLVNRWLGVVTAVAALLMAFARVYIAAHYPQDVLAGLLFGALISAAGYLLLRRALAVVIERLAGSRLRPLIAAGPAADGPA